MITTGFKVGQRVRVIKNTDNYRIGDILEIASVENGISRAFLFSCHGVSGYIWNYTPENLVDLRHKYKSGNFGIHKDIAACMELINEDWDS